jgi:hypothetical protein
MTRLEEIIEEMQSLNVDPLRIDEEIRKLESELSDFLMNGGVGYESKST